MVDPFDLVGEVVGGGVTIGRLGRKATSDHGTLGLGQAGVDHRPISQDSTKSVEQRRRRQVVIDRATAEHPMHGDADGPDVRRT